MLRLFSYQTQNSFKVLYVAEELGIDYEFVHVDLFKGEQKSDDFQIKNPMKKVPVCQYGDDFIFESGAICRFLGNLKTGDHYPQEPVKRAKVDQWLDFFVCHPGRWLNTLYYNKVLMPKIGKPLDEKACEEATQFLQAQLPVLEENLSKNKFLCGDQLTIADLAAFAYLEQARPIDFSYSSYPNIIKYVEQFEGRDSVKSARARFNS